MRMKMTPVIMAALKQVSLVCVALLLLGGATRSQAQPTTPNRGFHPAGSYAMTDLETINTTNGNLMYHMPLGSLPIGRGGNSGANLYLNYNGKLWDSNLEIHHNPLDPTDPATNYTLNLLQASNEGGWHYGIGYKYQVINRFDQYAGAGFPQCPSPEATYQWKVNVIFPDGSSHEFVPVGYNQDTFLRDGYYQIRPDGWLSNCGGGAFAVTSGMSYYSTDGSFVFMSVQYDGDNFPWNNLFTLYFPDGTKVTQASSFQKIEDRNGNFIKIQNTTYNSHLATEVIDQFNRHFIIEYSGLQDYIHTWGVNNEEVVTTVKWKTVWVYKRYVATLDVGYTGGPLDLFTSMLVVDQVILPAQSGSLSYTFGYNASNSQPASGNFTNGWGNINQVTLPAGAQAAYQYLGDGQNTVTWLDALQNSPTHKDLTYQLEYDGSSTPTTEAWNYSTVSNAGNASFGSIQGPDGGVLTEYFKNTQGVILWDNGLVYKSERAEGTVVERIWAQNTPPQGNASNPFVKTEFTSVRDAGGTLVKTAIKDFIRDKNGNITRIDEYDWVDYATVPRSNGNPTGIPSGAIKKKTVNTYYSPTPSYTDNTTNDPDIYSNPLSPRVRNAMESSEAQDGAGQAFSRLENYYDNSRTTANLTQQTSWDSFKGALTRPLTATNSISIFNQFDGNGNPTLQTDARGVQTLLIYDPINGFGGLYPTEIRAAYNTPVQRTTTQTYDFYRGLVTSSTDVNNGVSTKTSFDVFGRPTLVQDAYGQGALEKQTSTEYSDAARRIIVWSDLNTTADRKLVAIQHYDQMGRIRLSRQLEDSLTQSPYDETVGIKLQTRYRSSSPNSYELSSNPYRASSSTAAGSEQTMGWSRTKRDKGGRVIEAQTFAGAGLPAPWGTSTNTTGTVTTVYDGAFTTATDQAGKVRRSMIDALGRLVRVDEPTATGLGSITSPNQKTDYSYDPLGNLTQAVQGSQPSRNFQYTSLSRLRTAQNPESGTVSYEYDNSGNLMKKTDARGVQCSYTYDELNRAKTRVYTGDPTNTPRTDYFYDSQALPSGAPTFIRGASAGRLVAVTYGGGSSGSYQGYDVLGRPTVSAQKTDVGGVGQTYQVSYGYNLAGAKTSETYPSGRIVTTAYDNAGRISAVTGQKSAEANRTYASGYSYASHGAISAMQMSGGVMGVQWSYNPRLQPTQIELRKTSDNSVIMGLDFNFGVTSQNNGNLATQAIRIGASTIATQSYSYDHLNRLSAVSESNTVAAWQQTYDYDRWGNRAVRAGSYMPNASLTPPSAFAGDMSAFSANNNRVALAGYGYDAAGNQTSDPTTAANALAYDGENRLVSYTKAGATTSYSYDGNGQRVKKSDGGGATVYVYNVGGQLIAEYRSDPVPPAAGGGGTSYLIGDHLGNTKVVTNASGGVKARYDYLAFGEEIGSERRPAGIGYGGSDSTKQKFTAKERDNESGLDYFGARYYSSSQGRFTGVDPSDPILNKQASPDPRAGQSEFIGWISNPQRWNRYAYVLNNPLAYVDPDGREPEEPLVILQRALQRLGRFAQLAENFIKQGKTNILAYATQLALETIFGKTIAFTPTGLSGAEVEFAKEVAAFEGRGFQGVAKSQQGFDGIIHDGILPTSNPQPIQLQENSTGGEYRILSDGIRHENSARSIGLKNIDLYIKSTDKNVTVSSVVKFIQGGGNQGLIGLSTRGTFKKITIFTQDGVVQIERGKLISIMK